MKAQSDVQSQKSFQYQKLEWVGMTQIQTAIRVTSKEGLDLGLPALLDIGVDLAENNRGIHMSRLYRLQQEQILNHPLSTSRLSRFADACLESQRELSQTFACKLKLSWPVQTRSLKSNLAGFRNYPVSVIFEKSPGSEKMWLQVEVLYSSTCPQSASLSMEIFKNQNGPIERFPATPHAQRSRAVVQVQLAEIDHLVIENLIEVIEHALGTPVQTTVKKEDEMKFAELNAQNLMFCEDAARKISTVLEGRLELSGFSIYCEHQESLHPHNASSLKRHHFLSPESLRFD